MAETPSSNARQENRRNGTNEDGLKLVQNVTSLSNRSSDKASDSSSGWIEKNVDSSPRMKINQPLNSPVSPGTAQKKTVDGAGYSKETNFVNMAAQDALFRAGYDMRAYYGWLPGIAPVRFPAFIYSPPFFGFTPNVAMMKKDSSVGSQQDTSEKSDQWKQSKDDTPRESVRNTSELVQGHNKSFLVQNDLATGFANPDRSMDTIAFQKDVNSDEDEGLESGENDTESVTQSLKRRSLEPQQGQPQRLVSVIQENCSIRKTTENTRNAAPSEINAEAERKEQPKRGRASTRQIEKTEQYWDRRKKNNASAKKSRDARRQREILTNQRSAMLETENLRLRAELATLREENERLRKELNNFTSV